METIATSKILINGEPAVNDTVLELAKSLANRVIKYGLKIHYNGGIEYILPPPRAGAGKTYRAFVKDDTIYLSW